MSELSDITTSNDQSTNESSSGDKKKTILYWNPAKSESNTRYKSSPYDLINCLNIAVVNFSGSDMSRSDLESADMNSIMSKASSLPPGHGPWFSSRVLNSGDDPEKVPFWYGYDEETDENVCRSMKFDMILYLSESNEVVGYTYYAVLQDFTKNDNEDIRLNELKIFLKFSSIFSEQTYDLDNSLTVHIEKNFTGNLDIRNDTDTYDYLYPTKKSIITRKITSYPRYTNYIHHMKFDDTNMIINGDKIITKNYFGKLNILPLTLSYQNVKISRYDSDIVVLEWDKSNYKITSLLRTDRNGRNYVYFRGNSEEINTSEGSEITDLTPTHVILRGVDKYVNDPNGNQVLIPGEEIYLYSLSEKKILRKGGDDVKFVYNPYMELPGFIIDNSLEVNPDKSDDYIARYERIGSESFINYINSTVFREFGSVRIDNSNYTAKDYIISGFIGSFIITNGGNPDLKYYHNLEGTIGVKSKTKSTISNPDGSSSEVVIDNYIYVVNDSCIMERKTDSLVFYFTDKSSNITCNDEDERLKYTVSVGDTRNQILDGFRKNPITYSVIPDIICAFGGLLFYRDINNILRYL